MLEHPWDTIRQNPSKQQNQKQDCRRDCRQPQALEATFATPTRFECGGNSCCRFLRRQRRRNRCISHTVPCISSRFAMQKSSNPK